MKHLQVIAFLVAIVVLQYLVVVVLNINTQFDPAIFLAGNLQMIPIAYVFCCQNEIASWLADKGWL